MKTRIYLFFLFLIVIGSCKKDMESPVKSEPYEMNIYEFQLVDMSRCEGCCGPMIEAYLDSNKTELIYFKPVDLPATISYDLNRYYRGRFKVLVETYSCLDARGDPIPGQPAIIQPHFVNILEWEEK